MLRPDENKPKFMSGKNAMCRAPTFCRMEAGLRVSRAHLSPLSKKAIHIYILELDLATLKALRCRFSHRKYSNLFPQNQSLGARR